MFQQDLSWKKQRGYTFLLFAVHITLGFQSEVSAFIYNIHQKYVVRIVPIEINVRHASIVVRELHFQSKKATKFGCLVGDAAMNVHFWPVRGLYNGMLSAMALVNHRSLQFNDFIDYEGFMARLRAREQQGRSVLYEYLTIQLIKTLNQLRHRIV